MVFILVLENILIQVESLLVKSLVDTDVPFSGFPKLVTYLMILSVITWYCVTKIGGEKAINIPNSTKSILQLIAIGIAVIALMNSFTILLFGVLLLQIMH